MNEGKNYVKKYLEMRQWKKNLSENYILFNLLDYLNRGEKRRKEFA